MNDVVTDRSYALVRFLVSSLFGVSLANPSYLQMFLWVLCNYCWL